MPFKLQEVYYFSKPGKDNTELVLKAVKKAVEQRGIRDIVVASTSGKTALTFAESLEDEARIICVSESSYRREWGSSFPCIEPEVKEKLESKGVIVLDRIPYILHNSIYESSEYKTPCPEATFRDTLYAFGQGMKVAVEVVLTSVDCGVLQPYKYVIGVGGSGQGADTAVVLRSSYPATVFAKEKEKRLEIREILAMPLEKKYWE